MGRSLIPLEEFTVRPLHLFDKGRMLLTSGDFAGGHFNTMTVSWGHLGTIWHKPVALVYIRQVRYTFEFLERYETYTLCALPESRREVFEVMGSKSGRDVDKIAEVGLTPVAAARAAAPAFAEAELVIECRKIYWQDIDASRFLDPALQEHYSGGDDHRAFFGEILEIWGEEKYRG